MASQKKQKSAQTLPLKLRLQAWWEGYDPADVSARLRMKYGDAGVDLAEDTSAPEGAEGESKSSPVNPDDRELPFDPWDNDRIEVAQYIWGEGFCGPGGPEHIISMCKLLALNPEMSLLQIGSHLGGPARTLAEKYGTWVSGYEASPRLAKLAADKSHMSGMAKKAVSREYNPETIEKFDRKFDRALAKEALFTIEKKANILRLIEDHLKPSGLFLLTDFVLSSENVLGKDSYREWRDSESLKRRPFLTTAQELTELVKQARLNVRVSEDISMSYIELIDQAWAGADKVAARLTKQDDGDALLKTLLNEAEFWSNRRRMIESGNLRVWRILASKKADKPTMMSDW